MSSIPPIKPIETRYHGYRFRSRLEARWAVFFDELRIPWEYELEGFDVGNGLQYLPDFFLPDYDLFVEIKPSLSLISRPDWDKLARFIAYKDLLLVAGVPGTAQMFLFPEDGDTSDYWQELLDDGFQESPAWARAFIELYPGNVVALAPNALMGQRRAGDGGAGPIWGFIYTAWLYQGHHAINRAVVAANSARFGFGENKS